MQSYQPRELTEAENKAIAEAVNKYEYTNTVISFLSAGTKVVGTKKNNPLLKDLSDRDIEQGLIKLINSRIRIENTINHFCSPEDLINYVSCVKLPNKPLWNVIHYIVKRTLLPNENIQDSDSSEDSSESDESDVFEQDLYKNEHERRLYSKYYRFDSHKIFQVLIILSPYISNKESNDLLLKTICLCPPARIKDYIKANLESILNVISTLDDISDIVAYQSIFVAIVDAFHSRMENLNVFQVVAFFKLLFSSNAIKPEQKCNLAILALKSLLNNKKDCNKQELYQLIELSLLLRHDKQLENKELDELCYRLEEYCKSQLSKNTEQRIILDAKQELLLLEYKTLPDIFNLKNKQLKKKKYADSLTSLRDVLKLNVTLNSADLFICLKLFELALDNLKLEKKVTIDFINKIIAQSANIDSIEHILKIELIFDKTKDLTELEKKNIMGQLCQKIGLRNDSGQFDQGINYYQATKALADYFEDYTCESDIKQQKLQKLRVIFKQFSLLPPKFVVSIAEKMNLLCSKKQRIDNSGFLGETLFAKVKRDDNQNKHAYLVVKYLMLDCNRFAFALTLQIRKQSTDVAILFLEQAIKKYIPQFQQYQIKMPQIFNLMLSALFIVLNRVESNKELLDIIDEFFNKLKVYFPEEVKDLFEDATFFREISKTLINYSDTCVYGVTKNILELTPALQKEADEYQYKQENQDKSQGDNTAYERCFEIYNRVKQSNDVRYTYRI